MKRDDNFVIIGSCCTAMGMFMGNNKTLKYVLLSVGVVFSIAGFVIMLRKKKYNDRRM
jgi:hypothetical protein